MFNLIILANKKLHILIFKSNFLLKIIKNYLIIMETIKVIPEDLQRKFRSKQDLYDLMTIDCNNSIY